MDTYAPGNDDGPCATCGREKYKKHHLPIPSVCRAVNLADHSDMRRPVCSGCYKWARRHFTGKHAKCVNGALGASCASRFEKAEKLGVGVVGWEDRSNPLDGASKAGGHSAATGGSDSGDSGADEAGSGGSGHRTRLGIDTTPSDGAVDVVMPAAAVAPVSGLRYGHRVKREPPSPAHITPRGGSFGSFSIATTGLAAPVVTGSVATPTNPHVAKRGRWNGAAAAPIPHARRPAVAVKQHRRSASSSSDVSVISFSNLDNIPLDGPMSGLDSMDSLWGFLPDDVIGGVDIDGAGTLAPIDTGVTDMPFGESSLGRGAAAGFGFDVAHHVIHVDTTGMPHPTCAWVKFSGPLVRDVLRMGAPAAVVFKAGADSTADDAKAGEGTPSESCWVQEASQFSVSNAQDAHGVPEPAELTVCLPTFPLPLLAKLAPASGMLGAGLYVVPRSAATGTAADEDAVQMAALELQVLAPAPVATVTG